MENGKWNIPNVKSQLQLALKIARTFLGLLGLGFRPRRAKAARGAEGRGGDGRGEGELILVWFGGLKGGNSTNETEKERMGKKEERGNGRKKRKGKGRIEKKRMRNISK